MLLILKVLKFFAVFFVLMLEELVAMLDGGEPVYLLGEGVLVDAGIALDLI